LPSVHQVLEKLGRDVQQAPRAYIVEQIRRVLDDARGALLRGDSVEPVELTVKKALRAWTQSSLRHVINATGVILHTNLGRAPLAAFTPIAGYSNLEYDLATGRRGNRDVHCARKTEAIVGKPAVIVNNNAAAIFLVLNELAAGHEAIVSRGELIEIGDGFRIPEIMARSGAILRETGTTNRTRIEDYRNAINDRTRVLLRVHPSNFRITGFTARPDLRELVQLGRERGIPVYEDLGSGCLVDLREFGITEPMPQDSLAAGADLISFSGDKLLGGPQSGIIAGSPELVARVRRNPLFRALRQDKIFYQAMETTLHHILLGQLDSIPSLKMIRMSADAIRERAERMVPRIRAGAAVQPAESVIGGGSTPDLTLPTWVISVNADERQLRANDPAIIARIERDRVLIDLRTVFPEEEEAIVQALS
jgi:L-seryl-tRNA(Ser) seleniumtransferase